MPSHGHFETLPAGSTRSGRLLDHRDPTAGPGPVLGSAGLLVLLGGLAITGLVVAEISVAAPSIATGLHTGGGPLQLALSAYGLTYAVLLVFGARAGARGHRRMFLGGTALFAVSGLLSGLAPDLSVLVVGQLTQGVGAAALVPQVLSLVQLCLTGAARRRAVRLYSMTLGAAVAAGLLIGGGLITADPGGLGWRAVFLLDVPLGLLVVAGGRRWLPGATIATRARPGRPDRSAAVVFVLAVSTLVVVMTLGPAAGWPLWAWAMLAAGILALAVFARIEHAAARRGIEPLLDLAVLRVPRMLPALVTVFVSMGGYGVLIFAMSAFLQDARGLSALAAALTFTSYAGGFAVVNLTWARLPATLHRWVPATGLVVLAGADAALGALVATSGPIAVLVPVLVLAGAGHGSGYGAALARVTDRVPQHLAPAGSGLISTVTQLATLVGIAGPGTAYTMAVTSSGPTAPLVVLLVALAATALVSAATSLRLAAGGPTGPIGS